MQLPPTTCLFAARALRDFGDGFVAVLLPVYLLRLGLSPFAVGTLSTVSLLGSALFTFGIGFLGARYDHRQLLLGAACLLRRESASHWSIPTRCWWSSPLPAQSIHRQVASTCRTRTPLRWQTNAAVSYWLNGKPCT